MKDETLKTVANETEIRRLEQALLEAQRQVEKLAEALRIQKSVEVLRLNTDNRPNGRGVLTGTIVIKGVTSENYQANRVQYINGQRWVLQGWYGGGGGESFYGAEQHDLDIPKH